VWNPCNPRSIFLLYATTLHLIYTGARGFVGLCSNSESWETGLKRYREFLVLGFLTLLLATATAASTAPADKADTPGFGPVSQHPVTAANETSQGLVVTSACPLASSLSRIGHSSPPGIAPRTIIPVILVSHGLSIADIPTLSARERGWHPFLRAPPAWPLN
jgi:hypothetical protein